MNEYLIKKQNLFKDLKELEKQTVNVENNLCDAKNELKGEMQKKSLHEVKITELKRNVEYYTETSTKLRVKLAETDRIQSQFEVASECYEKSLSEFTENYIEQNNYGDAEQRYDVISQSTGDVQHQVICSETIINNNFEIIDCLLSELKLRV